MKKEPVFAVLRSYLWQYRFVAATFLLFCGIFLGVFSLYRLETEAVVYAALLCLFATAIILGIHFFVYYRKHCELVRICRNIALLGEELPPPENLREADFGAMITALQAINRENRNRWNAERSDSVDYYTTWVHQIKAPIAVMRLMLQGSDTEESRELLAELFRVEQYTEMALCYIRLDGASTDFVLRRQPLDAIIRQAIRKFAPQFVRRRIRLSYAGTNAVVLTDEKWLLFILEQLLSNAIKYTKAGTVTIAVSGELLTIADTGIGIAPEDLPRIFEKGFTGYNGHADKKATGLGLYLCRKTAEKLSHRLSVTSVAGEGTTVTIDLSTVALEPE